MKNIIWFKLILSLVFCQAAGLVGGIFTAQSVKTWYNTLSKPSFNPPSWVFGPVWTTLYILMGIALYIVWKNDGEKNINTAIALFIVQLMLNVFWSYLFFGTQNPKAAFFEVIVLWILILATIIAFYPVSQTASYLLIPYLLWVSFASLLNFSIWRINS